MLIVLVSLPIPFVGRTAIGWIVDATTFGATILYGFASAAVFKESGREGCKTNRVISGICLVILFVFMVFLVFPSAFSDYTIETETYVLMTVWSILGLFFFNSVIRKDHARNFGKAIIVWIALLAFIILMALTWTERTNEAREDVVVNEIADYMKGTADGDVLAMDEDAFLDIQREKLHDADSFSAVSIGGLLVLSLLVMVVNYTSTMKWEKKATEERDHARSVAFTDPLTGVKSKHAFAVREGEMETQIAEGEAGEFAVIVCDVNGLKKINDTLGHKAGDEYIRSASVLLCDYYKHSPVFRVGGDEFVVLLQGRDYDARHEILRDINAQIEENLKSGSVVASLGMAEYEPKKDESFHEVFKRADALMYDRKMQLKGMGADIRD